jgi:hypothetical protein
MKLNELRNLVQEVVKEQKRKYTEEQRSLYFQLLGGGFGTYGLIDLLEPEEAAALDRIATVIKPYGLSPYALYLMTFEGTGGYEKETLDKLRAGETPEARDLERLGITFDNLEKLTKMHQEEVIDNFKQIIANVNSRKPEGRDDAVAAAVRRGGRLD